MTVLDETTNGRSSSPEHDQTVAGELDAALAAYPDRFIGFAKPRLDEQIGRDVERDVVGRGFQGIGELTPPANGAAGIEP